MTVDEEPGARAPSLHFESYIVAHHHFASLLAPSQYYQIVWAKLPLHDGLLTADAILGQLRLSASQQLQFQKLSLMYLQSRPHALESRYQNCRLQRALSNLYHAYLGRTAGALRGLQQSVEEP